MSEHPFQQWVDAAKPKAQLWRTLVGFALIVVMWLAWTVVLGAIVVGSGVMSAEQLSYLPWHWVPPEFWLRAVRGGIVLMAAWGLWLGVWVALKRFHKRGLASALSHDGGWSHEHFGVGVALAVGYSMMVFLYATVTGDHFRQTVSLGEWFVAMVPLAILILIQSAGEEIVFRGYLTQQLAARWRHPIVWGLLPSVLFGLAHVSWGAPLDDRGLYYLAGTVMLGLVMTALVWRTGSLVAAIGFHFANNVAAVLLVGSAGNEPSLFDRSPSTMSQNAPAELLAIGLLLAFVLSPFAPLPKGQALRRNETRAAP